MFSFANINTVDGGSHPSGFRSALTRTINAAAKWRLFKDVKENLTGDDVRGGTHAVVSVKLPQPQFEGRPRQAQLDIQGYVSAHQRKAGRVFRQEPPVMRKIVGKDRCGARREAARKARDLTRRKGALIPEACRETGDRQNAIRALRTFW